MADNPLNQLTNANQSDKSSLWAAISFAMRQKSIVEDGMIPATVMAYDRTTNLATVKPLIQLVTVENTVQPRAPLVSINTLSIGGGGFHISFPIKPGDLGWIFASDRDLGMFKQQLAESAPTSGRIKSFSDGLFIPDVFRKYQIDGADEASMVIQSTDGATKISISGDSINITAPTKVTVTTPLAQFTEDVQVDGKLTVSQQATMNGGLTAADGQNCTLPSGTTIGGINVSTHGHEQNGDSGRTSGGMQE